MKLKILLSGAPVMAPICRKPMPSRPAVLPVRRFHAVLRISPLMTPHKISLVVGTSRFFTSSTVVLVVVLPEESVVTSVSMLL